MLAIIMRMHASVAGPMTRNMAGNGLIELLVCLISSVICMLTINYAINRSTSFVYSINLLLLLDVRMISGVFVIFTFDNLTVQVLSFYNIFVNYK